MTVSESGGRGPGTSGEPVPREPDFFDRRLGLARLREAVDQLGERLSRIEGMSGGRSDADPQALAIVQDILSIPSAGLHPGELFALALDRVSRLLAADRAMLFVAESGGRRLAPRSAQGFRREDLDSIRLLPGEGFVGRVFSERRVLTYPAGGEGEAPDAFIERFPVQEAIAVPVRAEDGVAGVLFAGRRRLGPPFSPNDVLLLLVIADRVGVGLVHQAMLDRRARHIGRLAELRALAAALAARPPLDDLLGRAAEAGCRLLDVPVVAVALGAGPGDLHVVTSRGLPAGLVARAGVGGALTAQACAGEEPVACRDVQALSGERSFLGAGGFHGALLIPIQAGASAGVLYVADAEVRDFSVDEVEAARVLAALVAAAVDHERAGATLLDALRRAHADRDGIVQAERDRTVSAMAAGLVRELNSIFAVVLGQSRLLQARAQAEPLREGLGLVEEAAWKGADIVQRLNVLGAPAASEPSGPVDVAALVRDVLETTGPAWKDERAGRRAPIEAVTDIQDTPHVMGNPAALREALAALVLNAVDAMPGGGRLAVSVRGNEAGVDVTVEDSGEGIPPETRPRVWVPFFTTRLAHLGLGLSVAQSVIARHGGRIDLSSPPGGGTRAALWLPGAGLRADDSALAERASPADPGAPAFAAAASTGTAAREPLPPRPEGDASARAAGGGQSGPGPASILVLEDEPAVRSLLVEALTQAGHTVETATDGIVGLAKVESTCFDVVLADLALPQRSGLAIARTVKHRHPETPVVLITGWGHLLNPERLREHGVDLMLVKPFRLERVLSVVGDALRLRPAP